MGLALLSPIWAFELLYRAGVARVSLPNRGVLPRVPPAMADALWVAAGEVPDAGVEPLWAGNFFRRPNPPPGGTALDTIARGMLASTQQPPLRTLEASFRRAAIVTWLTRHANEGELKQYLVEWSYFGRGAWGARAAALRYFGRPVEQLTPGQIALLAGLPAAPSSFDPALHPDRAAKRRRSVLTRLRAFGLISARASVDANEETISALPRGEETEEEPP